MDGRELIGNTGPTVLGAALPDFLYPFIYDRDVAVPIRRWCKICGYRWANVEVPLVHRAEYWTGAKSDCCQIHIAPAWSNTTQAPGNIDESKYLYSPGIRLAVQLGAVHRRRHCRNCQLCFHAHWRHTVKGGGGPDMQCYCGCEGYDECPGKWWGTLEVSRDGVIVEDVSLCPRCEGPSGRHIASNPTRRRRALEAWGRKFGMIPQEALDSLRAQDKSQLRSIFIDRWESFPIGRAGNVNDLLRQGRVLHSAAPPE